SIIPAVGTVVPGTSFIYTITVSNSGPSTATNVTVSDPVPVGLTSFVWRGNGKINQPGPLNDIIASLASGATVVYEVTATVAPEALAQLVNTVTVAAFADTDPTNDQATDKDTPRLISDLAITKTDGSLTYAPGVGLIYTIVVSNLGPSNVVGVMVADIFDAALGTPTWTASGTLGTVFVGAGAGNLAQMVSVPVNGSITYTVTVAQVNSAKTGDLVDTATVTVPVGVTDPTPGNNTATDTDTMAGRIRIVLGSDKSPATPEYVRVINQDTGAVLSEFVPYENGFQGGIRVATGDLNGDGIDEIVTAPGRSRASELRVFTQQGVELPTFRTMAYETTYLGGAQVAVGDVNGDGKNDLVTVPTQGVAQVRVFLNQSPNPDPIQDTPYRDFLAFSSAVISGGVIGVADMGHGASGTFTNVLDGKAEIVVGTGAGTLATISVFDVSGPGPYTPVQTFQPFTAISSAFNGGVSLDVARVDSNLVPDIVVGAGSLGASRVEVWTWDTNTATISLLGGFAAFTESDVASRNAPVRAAAQDLTAGGVVDTIVAVQGPGGMTGEIHSFHLISLVPFTVVLAPNPPRSGLPGPYFVTTIATPPVVPLLHVYQNPTLHEDVNQDGKVSAIDALLVINFANLGQPLPLDPVPPAQPHYDWDVDGNDAVTASDVLQVINQLDSQSHPAGEGEYVAAATPAAPPAIAAATPAVEAPVWLPRLPKVSWQVPFPHSPSAMIGPWPPAATAYAGRLANPPAQRTKAVPPPSATARSAALFELLGSRFGRLAESDLDDVLTDIAGDVQAAQHGRTAEDGGLGGLFL
ncbi:MAG: dockerin type I domain-containing protein, partial [Planctomycetota bacterium]|nr:dockerin type I domain-containing protein [Planctomycetota bacterium]